MAVNAVFQADFRSFYDALQKADVQLKTFESGAGSVERQLTRMGNSFSGVKIIQDAHLMTAAMLEAGGTVALTEKELKRLDATVSEASEKMRKMGLEVPPGFKQIHDAAEDATSSNKSWTQSFFTLSNAIQGFLALKIVGFIKDAIASTFDYANQLENLSVATGISTAGLQRLESIGVTSGVSMETLSKAVEQLHRRLDDPVAIAAIEKMGLSYARIRNLKPEDQFIDIAQAISQIEDPVDRANRGSDLFGKTWDTISPAITAHMREVLNGAVIMSDGTVKALDKAGDAWDVFYLNSKRTLKSYLGLIVQSVDEAKISIRDIAPGVLITDVIRGSKQANIKNLEQLPETPNSPLGALFQPQGPQPVIESATFLAESNKLSAAIEAQEQKNKKAAEDWAVALGDVRDNWKAIFATVQHLTDLNTLKGSLQTFQALNMSTPGAGLAHLLPNFSMQDKHLGFGPADIKSAARANIDAATAGIFDGVGASVPKAIISAFEGGGSAIKAAAGSMGLDIGQNVVTKFGKSITDTLGKTFGGAINAVLPGIGTLAGPLVGLVGKLFGPSEESSKVSPLRDEFFKMQGGLETLNPKVQELTGSLQLVDNIFQAKTVDQYNAAIQQLSSELAFQDQAMQSLTATAQKYGFTLEELGPAFERQQLDKKAQELYQDWQVLASGGVDIDNIARRMGDSINQFVGNALAMGTEVPEAMRPMLEKMAQMGLLTDASGNKIDDLSEAGINFTLTMSDGFKALIAEVQKLTDAISRGLGLAIQNLPDKTVTIHAKYDLPPEINQDFDSSLQGFTTGTRGRLLNFGAGTAVRLHGFEQVRTASEVQSDAAHLQAIKAEIVGLRNDMQDLPRQIIYAGQVA